MNPFYVWKDFLDRGWSMAKSSSSYTGQHNTEELGHVSMSQIAFFLFGV
jgi:hypothetical protein